MNTLHAGRQEKIANLIEQKGILLLAPKDLYWGWPVANDFCRKIYPSLRATFPQLAAMIPDIKLRFLDCMFNRDISFKQYTDILTRYPVICLSALTPVTALNMEITVRLIRKHNPEAIIITGGHHATFYPDEWLARGVDIIIRREAELTFRTLIQNLAEGVPFQTVKGISFLGSDNKPVHNEDCDFVKNLDDLPMPNWDIVDLSLYKYRLKPKGYAATLETSRGCPNRCSFCCVATMWKNRQRFKSAERVLDEIDYLVKRGVRTILIGDDNFGIRRERDEQIYEGILSRGYDLGFWSFVRADTVIQYPEHIKLAARAGLRHANIGYESLDDKTLARYQKGSRGIKAIDYEEVYKILHDNGVFVVGLFVRDFDFDAEKTSSFRIWRRLGKICDVSSQTKFIPMRGTKGYQDIIDKGYQVKDMFYHDRFMPAYRFKEKQQGFQYALTAVWELLKPRNFLKMFFGTFVERVFFRSMYYGIFFDIAHVNLLTVKSFLITCWPKLELNRRQEIIKNSYFRRYDVDDDSTIIKNRNKIM